MGPRPPFLETTTNHVLDPGISTQQLAEIALSGQTDCGVSFVGTDQATLFLAGRALRDFLNSLAAQGLI